MKTNATVEILNWQNGELDISRNTGEVIKLCKRIYELELQKYEVQK